MNRQFKPRPGIYDVARTQLGVENRGLFDPPLLNTIQRDGHNHVGPWRGAPMNVYSLRRMGFPPNRWAQAVFGASANPSGRYYSFTVALKDADEAELNRLAEVYMDLINALRIGD